MKAALTISVIIAALSLSAFADETITMTGDCGGRQVAITTSTNRITITPAARLVSVYNGGSAVVYAAVRVSAAEYAAMITGTNAVAIRASSTYEFVGGNPIGSLTLSGASGTNTNTVSVQK